MCRFAFMLLLLAVVLLPTMASAQPATDNLLTNIINEYRDKASAWEPVIRRYATSLFWLLAGIEFAFTGILLALRGADLQAFTAELVRRVLFIGFFYALLLHGGTWARAIVDSLRQVAGHANRAAGGLGGISPATIFDTGMRIAIDLGEAYSIFKPSATVGLAIAALVIAVCFALIAAFLVLALVEMYIVLNAGVILLGLGGSRWTQDFAVKYLTYAFSVGMKLFVLQLLLGLSETMIRDWARDVGRDHGQVLLMVGGSIVLLALVKGIPDLIQSLITGISPGSGAVLPAAAGAVAGAAMGTTMRATGGAAAVYEATKLAQSQGATGMVGVTRAAMGQVWQAGKSDLAGQLAGQNRFGTLGGRLAYQMRQDRQTQPMAPGWTNTISAGEAPRMAPSASPTAASEMSVAPSTSASDPTAAAPPATTAASSETPRGDQAPAGTPSGGAGPTPGAPSPSPLAPADSGTPAPAATPPEPSSATAAAPAKSPLTAGSTGTPHPPSGAAASAPEPAPPHPAFLDTRSTYISGVPSALPLWGDPSPSSQPPAATADASAAATSLPSTLAKPRRASAMASPHGSPPPAASTPEATPAPPLHVDPDADDEDEHPPT